MDLGRALRLRDSVQRSRFQALASQRNFNFRQSDRENPDGWLVLKLSCLFALYGPSGLGSLVTDHKGTFDRIANLPIGNGHTDPQLWRARRCHCVEFPRQSGLRDPLENVLRQGDSPLGVWPVSGRTLSSGQMSEGQALGLATFDRPLPVIKTRERREWGKLQTARYAPRDPQASRVQKR